jgi:hypothetical protein
MNPTYMINQKAHTYCVVMDKDVIPTLKSHGYEEVEYRAYITFITFVEAYNG